jgi:apolipoprotein N-acyltransferase
MPRFARLRPLALALATGLLLALASPGIGLSFLAWIAWVPLFRAIATGGVARAASVAFVSGLTFTAATLSWVAFPIAVHGSVGIAGAVALAGAAGGLYAAPFAVYGAALAFEGERRGRFGIALAALLWPALEWARTLGPLAAPWNLLGYTQPAWNVPSQIAEAAGVYGVGATILLVNAVIHVATTETRGDARRRLALATAVILGIFAGGAWLGERAGVGPPPRAIRVGVVQPAGGGGAPALDAAIELTRRAAAAAAAVVVWPESAARLVHDGGSAGESAALVRLAALAREIETPLVLAVEGVVREPIGRGSVSTSRNRVLLVDRDGRISATYDKRILVPFGETIPAPGVFAGLRALAAGERPIRPGDRPALFRIEGARAAVLVCWEAIFPAFVGRAAAGADLTIVVTNDDWLGSPLAAEQHSAMAALRAVETRVPVVRAARSGISAIVGADGTSLARTALGDVAELVVDVPLGTGRTIGPRAASLFPPLAGLAAAGLLVYAGGSRRTGASRTEPLD